MTRLFSVIFIAVFGFNGLAQGAPVIGNASFENPALAAADYEYDPSGGQWLYTPFAGVAATGAGGFFVPLSPDGSRAGFIQGWGSSISQEVSGFNTGETYTLGFYLAKRTDGCPQCGSTIGDQTLSVLVNGTVVFSPLNAGTLSPGFQAFTSDAFMASASILNITFLASGPGDRTAFVDQVTVATVATVASVPEPGSFVLFGLGAAGVLALRRRKS